MKGSLSYELETGLPAGELWAVYSTMRIVELVPELLPHLVAKVDVEEGDGGVGTVLRITYSPGGAGPKFRREKFVKIDNEQRVKEVEVLEGGLLDLGFISYFFRFQVAEKSSSSSVFRSTVEYENLDEAAPIAAAAALESISLLFVAANAVVNHVMGKKASSISS